MTSRKSPGQSIAGFGCALFGASIYILIRGRGPAPVLEMSANGRWALFGLSICIAGLGFFLLWREKPRG